MSKFKFTDLKSIPGKIELAKQFYRSRQARLAQSKSPRATDINERIRSLQKLYWAVKDNEERLIAAASKDFHRARSETLTIELVPLYNNILYLIKNMKKEIEPKKIKVSLLAHWFGTTFVEKIALGTVLVISPFNFPILLALDPLAGAIAGGNSVVFKPSELTPACAEVMEEICNEAFEKGQVETVQGGAEETSALVESGKFDKIFYTGSTTVGTIIAEKAAKSLTPCVLELGGKSPVFISPNLPKSQWETAIRRIYYSSMGNAGQICVAADYVLCPDSIYDEFVDSCKKVLNEFYPSVTSDTEYTHMIHERAYNRIQTAIETTKGQKTVAQHSDNLPPLCIPPTIISDVSWDDPSMTGENFGPILPIMRYTDLDETIDTLIKRFDTPLVQYIFTNSKDEIDHILTRIRSGACVVNDTLLHVGIEEAPFGGIGTSGYGNYHGPYTFKTFTHERTIFKQPFWVDLLIYVRYPPFDKLNTRISQISLEDKPNFDRNGRRIYGIKNIGIILTSGVLLGFLINAMM